MIRSIETESAGPVFKKVAECLYRHIPTGTYYGLVKRGGKQFRKSFKTTDRKLADRSLAEFRNKVGRLTSRDKVRKATFSDLSDAWLSNKRPKLKRNSIDRLVTGLKQLKEFFGEMPVRGITEADCCEWERSRGARGGASWFNMMRITLQAVFRQAIHDGLLMDNPATCLARRKLPKANRFIPSHEQFRQVVAQIRRADCRAQTGGDLVELLAYSGMRLTEAISLVWGDVDFGRAVFVVTGGEQGTKNHEARVVPLFPAMRDLLLRLKGDTTPAPTVRVIGIDGARTAMSIACRKVGSPIFTHHSLRHYFVSNAIEAGADFKVIAAWVGHKDGGILVAKTYGHLRDTHSHEMARRMTFSASQSASPSTEHHQ